MHLNHSGSSFSGILYTIYCVLSRKVGVWNNDSVSLDCLMWVMKWTISLFTFLSRCFWRRFLVASVASPPLQLWTLNKKKKAVCIKPVRELPKNGTIMKISKVVVCVRECVFICHQGGLVRRLCGAQNSGVKSRFSQPPASLPLSSAPERWTESGRGVKGWGGEDMSLKW